MVLVDLHANDGGAFQNIDKIWCSTETPEEPAPVEESSSGKEHK